MVGALLVGCLASCSDSDAPDTSTASRFDPFATASASTPPDPTTSPTDLSLGDCFDVDNFAPGASIDRHAVREVPCDGPHQHEVYALALDPDPQGAPYPGDVAMASLAEDRCLERFEPAIGTDYLDAPLDFAAITPDADSWRMGDRSIVCAVHSTDFVELTGSVRATTTTTAPDPATSSASASPEGG